MMRIEKIYMTYNKYGPDQGAVTGTIEFSGEYGDVTVKIGAKAGAEIIRVCADQIVDASREVAEMMTADIVEHLVSIPPPENPQ